MNVNYLSLSCHTHSTAHYPSICHFDQWGNHRHVHNRNPSGQHILQQWASETKHKNVRLLQRVVAPVAGDWNRYFSSEGKLLHRLLNKVLGRWGVCYRWKMFPLSRRCDYVTCRLVRSSWSVDIFFFANNLLKAFEPVSEAFSSFWSSYN